MGVELGAEEAQDVSVILSQEQPGQSAQPAHQPIPEKLDKATVRAATMQAAAQGIDPFDMVVGDLANPPQAKPAVVVPEKFVKPNGEVDVEKLNASTKQLDEAIQNKKQVIQSVEDYLSKQKEFRNLPNADKVRAATADPIVPPSVPVAPMPIQPQAMSLEQIKAKIAQDLAADAPGTVLDLVQIAVNQRLERDLEPLRRDAEERKLEQQDRQLRANLTQLAEKDPRVLHPVVFDAINAKLESDPDLWKLKNPHKVAWLEVKEEMRLGDLPSSGSPAQPSRPLSPILGGGTPPPAPSSSGELLSAETLLEASKRVGRDPRDMKYDPKQAANMRAAAKEFFDKQDRQARR